MEILKAHCYNKEKNITDYWFQVIGTGANGKFILARFDTEQEANDYLQQQIQISKDFHAYMKQRIQDDVRTVLGLNF